jgi:hypothetical protein
LIVNPPQTLRRCDFLRWRRRRMRTGFARTVMARSAYRSKGVVAFRFLKVVVSSNRSREMMEDMPAPSSPQLFSGGERNANAAPPLYDADCPSAGRRGGRSTVSLEHRRPPVQDCGRRRLRSASEDFALAIRRGPKNTSGCTARACRLPAFSGRYPMTPTSDPELYPEHDHDSRRRSDLLVCCRQRLRAHYADSLRVADLFGYLEGSSAHGRGLSGHGRMPRRRHPHQLRRSILSVPARTNTVSLLCLQQCPGIGSLPVCATSSASIDIRGTRGCAFLRFADASVDTLRGFSAIRRDL